MEKNSIFRNLFHLRCSFLWTHDWCGRFKPATRLTVHRSPQWRTWGEGVVACHDPLNADKKNYSWKWKTESHRLSQNAPNGILNFKYPPNSDPQPQGSDLRPPGKGTEGNGQDRKLGWKRKAREEETERRDRFRPFEEIWIRRWFAMQICYGWVQMPRVDCAHVILWCRCCRESLREYQSSFIIPSSIAIISRLTFICHMLPNSSCRFVIMTATVVTVLRPWLHVNKTFAKMLQNIFANVLAFWTHVEDRRCLRVK